jgi:preprotein translocase subunit SecA
MAELPEMSAHHLDPLTGEDEFEREPEMAMEGAGAPARGKRGNGGTRAQPMRNKPAGVALDPNDPATWGKVSRNAQCPCGSGKKYKHCHGKLG